ncbi:hypothetical protein L3Q82_003261 [Scortum barcoo]|uniref:Uncharacterized protein n=1 Tax=Scortum barcoo TaxID=214431 RepID=A0ACB8VRL3_9TELE|nr:hypothetical protein L3Q82_003261 [Scortum barcoo]
MCWWYLGRTFLRLALLKSPGYNETQPPAVRSADPLFLRCSGSTTGAAVERVSSTNFLGVHISDDLSWTTNTASLAKKAQQRLYFLRKLKRASAPPPIMTTFYRGTIESILTSCITVWGGSYTVHNRKALQRIVRTAERIIGVPLPSLQDLYTTRLTRKAITIVNDASHPAHSLFSLLPSGKRNIRG